MNATQEIIDGTLNGDGTLTLDHQPQLPAGRVRVVLQVVPSTPVQRRGLADVINEIQVRQLARGFQRRTAAEIQAAEAGRQADEDEYERRMETLRSQTRSGSPRGNP